MASVYNISIPSEVCSMIFRYTSRKDLTSLSRVSESFKRIAQPQLYRDIHLRWHNAWIFGLPPHCILLQTILNNPEVASLIHTVRIGRSVSEEPWNGMPPLPTPELKLVRQKLHALKMPTTDTWTQCLSSGGIRSIPVALACLLLFLPNLKALDLNARFDPGSSAFTDMLQGVLARRSTSTTVQFFPSLKRADYLTDHELYRLERKHEFRDFQWLFYLPSIETIQAAALELCVPLAWPTDPPLANGLIALHLRQSQVNEESLAQLFSVTPSLKTFEYGFVCDTDLGAPLALPRRYLDCKKLGASLQITKASLETLIISSAFIVRTAQEVDPVNHFRGYLGSLRDFLKLRTLHVPLVVLLGWTPHPGIRLARNLPLDLFRLCCTAEKVRSDFWAWPDDAILDQFREYFDAETSLELDTVEIFSLATTAMQQEMETTSENAGIFHEIYHGQ